MLTFLVISLALFNNVSPASQHGTNRKTIYGWIRGKVTSRVPGLKVEEYLGVPYALPPIGHFRFKVRILFYTFWKRFSIKKKYVCNEVSVCQNSICIQWNFPLVFSLVSISETEGTSHMAPYRIKNNETAPCLPDCWSKLHTIPQTGFQKPQRRLLVHEHL